MDDDASGGRAPKSSAPAKAQNQVTLDKADKSKESTAKPIERKIIRNAVLQLESSNPDKVKKKITAIAEAKEGFVEGRAYLLDHNFEGASEEFERALYHLDEAVALDPQGPLAQKIHTVKQKVREAQASLAQGRNLPPHLLEDLRQELKTVLP